MSIKNDRWSALSLKDRADLMNMYITNGISDLKEMKKHYNGVPYRDLNTSDYDYFNASPEMSPTEEGQHWYSRNPHTGRLLKGENHPTFDLMVEGENKAGYKIVRGYNDDLYSIPNTPDNYVEEVNNYSSGGNISWEDVDNFVDKIEPWISGASLTATGASFIPGAQPIAVPAAVVLNGAGIALDTYQAARALSQKDYKDTIINGGEALLGMFGSKAASKIAKTAAGKYIGKIKEQIVNERLVNSGEKMVRLMRKGKTQEEAAEQVLKNAVNYVENSTKLKDVTNAIYDKYIDKGNKVSSVGDAIADGYDLIEGIDWDPLNEIKPAFISETKSYGGRILSGEENIDTALNSIRPLSREEYLQKQRDGARLKALENSLNRTEPSNPLFDNVPYDMWQQDLHSDIDQTLNDLLYITSEQERTLQEARLESLRNAKYEPVIIGNNCIYTALDNYGDKYKVSGNLSFLADPSKYGFKEISTEEIKPGDLVQYNKNHMMLFDSYDENGLPLYNYSNSRTRTKEDIQKKHPYERHNIKNNPKYKSFTFIGLPEDIELWNSNYDNYKHDYSSSVVEQLKNVSELPKDTIKVSLSKKLTRK